mmetsp:Transcript_124591/g.398914  ORF Transcript_124591/g.398914 Transcript_124591/m.398914 type:complete len:247 (-) Transcript_124591:4271-5011(-)
MPSCRRVGRLSTSNSTTASTAMSTHILCLTTPSPQLEVRSPASNMADIVCRSMRSTGTWTPVGKPIAQLADVTLERPGSVLAIWSLSMSDASSSTRVVVTRSRREPSSSRLGLATVGRCMHSTTAWGATLGTCVRQRRTHFGDWSTWVEPRRIVRHFRLDQSTQDHGASQSSSCSPTMIAGTSWRAKPSRRALGRTQPPKTASTTSWSSTTPRTWQTMGMKTLFGLRIASRRTRVQEALAILARSG